MNKICIIAVHPDDETLGAGGTILKHLAKGDEVYCVFVTGGNEEQKFLVDKVTAAYKFTGTFSLNLPELLLGDTSLNYIIPLIHDVFKQVQPDTIIIPNRSDVHSDHRTIFDAVYACTKSFRYPYIKKILMMEVISETDFNLALPERVFIPNYYVDITSTFARKNEILKIYESELLPYPETRNLNTMEALNRYRGSQVSAEYAESFMALKIVD